MRVAEAKQGYVKDGQFVQTGVVYQVRRDQWFAGQNIEEVVATFPTRAGAEAYLRGRAARSDEGA